MSSSFVFMKLNFVTKAAEQTPFSVQESARNSPVQKPWEVMEVETPETCRMQVLMKSPEALSQGQDHAWHHEAQK